MIDVNYICEYCGKIVEPEETDVVGNDNVFGIATKVHEGWVGIYHDTEWLDFCSREHRDIWRLLEKVMVDDDY